MVGANEARRKINEIIAVSGGTFDSESVLAASPQWLANNDSIPDAQGVLRTVHSGSVWLMVNQTGSAHADGPNTKTLSPSQFTTATNLITIDDGTVHTYKTGHGFRESGNKISFAPGSASSVAPAGLSYGTYYYVDIQDAATPTNPSQTFKLLDAPGGSAVAFTDQGTGTHLMSRDLVIAFDAADWVTVGSGAEYYPVVNYQFRSVAQAYQWFSKYSGSSHMGIFAADASSVNCLYKSDDSAHVITNFETGNGVNFEGLSALDIWGYLGASPHADAGGADVWDDPTYKSIISQHGNPVGHATLCRCRMITNIVSGERGTPIWFRIHGSVRIANVNWDFKIPAGATHEIRSCFRCAHGLFSFYNTGVVVFSTTSVGHTGHGICTGDMRAIDAMEGGQVYWIAGFHMIYGLKAWGAALSIGTGGSCSWGTPDVMYGLGTFDNGAGSLSTRYDRIVAKATCDNDGTHVLQSNTTFSDTAEYGPTTIGGQTTTWTAGMAGE